MIFATSPSFSGSGSSGSRGDNTRKLCAEVAQALVKYVNWSDSAAYMPVAELRNALCSLCSFRSLQKRLQVRYNVLSCCGIFKLTSCVLLNALHMHGNITTVFFIFFILSLFFWSFCPYIAQPILLSARSGSARCPACTPLYCKTSAPCVVITTIAATL